MPLSNRWYPQFTAAQDLQSAIRGAFDRIYHNQDQIDSIDQRSLETAKALAALDPPWTSYTPTITPKADMTITNLVISAAYLLRGRSLQLRVQVKGSLGSAATNTILISLPSPPVDGQCFASYLLSASSIVPSIAIVSGGQIAVQYDETLLHTSAGLEVVVQGVVEIK